MSHAWLRCTACARRHDADVRTLRCRSCRAPLEVEYGGAGTRSGVQPPGWSGPEVPLPLHSPDALIALGEGGTPAVELAALGELVGLKRLYGKLEFLNPTGSFKDRGTAVMLAAAREQGVAEIVEDSSGNAGASVAAYAARAGIRAHIFAPADAPEAKLRQIRVYGAETHTVPGPREAATEAALDFCRETGKVYASHSLSPYFTEGTKLFAYEVTRQFPDGPPRHVVLPVGNGSLLIGAWTGFRELKRRGVIEWVPRLHCVQSEAFMPIVAALNGAPTTLREAGRTIAGGISVAAPVRREQMLGVLRSSKGAGVAVDDRSIARWQTLLAEREGIYAEPTSAAAFAGLERLVDAGIIGRDDLTLVPVTGFGLKDAAPS